MTTTDPFAEAAIESAVSKYTSDWDAFEQEPVDDWGFSDCERRAHIAGWKAARAHLAAQEGHRRVRKYADDWDTCTCGYDAWPCRSQEPTDAEVEAAFWAFTREHFTQAYSREHGDQGPSSRQSMRAALTAARTARRDEEKR